jgi:hypothetical protein
LSRLVLNVTVIGAGQFSTFGVPVNQTIAPL